MKRLSIPLLLSILLMSCTEKKDNSAEMAFQKNSETVLANLKGWQNENLDYSVYADDFAMIETGFNSAKDSVGLEEMKASDKELWKAYDFKLLTDPVNLLPGVNQDTREPDGSVRYYGDWEITRPATDSTAAKSAVIHTYESFDFDENGKIRYQQIYGDFTGLLMYLNEND